MFTCFVKLSQPWLFQNKAKTGGGGLFNAKTRYRLLGVHDPSGRERKEKFFWSDVRNYVRGALIDLQLFIEIAGDNNVRQTLNEQKLKDMVETLLWHPVPRHDPPDLNRAEIARLFVDVGLNYLEYIASLLKLDSLSHKNTIGVTKNLSNLVVENLHAHIDQILGESVHIKQKQKGQLLIQVSEKKLEIMKKKYPKEMKELFQGEDALKGVGDD